jgi:hypothetical protein
MSMRRPISRLAPVFALAALLASLVAGPRAAAAQPEPAPPGTALPEGASVTRVEDGASATLGSLAGEQGTAVVFWSNNCLWIDKYEDRITDLVGTFQPQGVRFVFVNANDASAFPKESMEASREAAQDYDATYVRDPDAALAEQLGASRTPHVFLFDAGGTLVYTGAVDDSPGDPSGVGQAYFRDALDAVASGGEVPVGQTKAFGCMIKTPN